MNIRKLRIAKGWSQQQLVDASGVSRATVQRIEAGKVLASKETALALGAALGCDGVTVRSDSELTVRVTKAMACLNAGQRPAPRLLRQLPTRCRGTIEEACDARADLLATHDDLLAAQKAHCAALEQRSANLEATGQWGSMDSVFALSDKFSALSDKWIAALKRDFAAGERLTVMLSRFCG